jgi:hypothetical protein
MEPTTGLEPVNLFLTKEVLYLLSYVGPGELPEATPYTQGDLLEPYKMERETGFEPATLSLEG